MRELLSALASALAAVFLVAMVMLGLTAFSEFFITPTPDHKQTMTTPLTLACSGNLYNATEEEGQPESIGIIVDFAARRVRGFPFDLEDDPLIIAESANEIGFSNGAAYTHRQYNVILAGTLDRITGALQAYAVMVKENARMIFWKLNCRPAQRMF
jgi:hypothetical protein